MPKSEELTMSTPLCLRSGSSPEAGSRPTTTHQAKHIAQSSSIAVPRRRRRHFSDEELERIRPYFTQYYMDDYTYEEIMFAMRDHHQFNAGESTYKRLPAKWALPNRNWSSDQKDQELARLSGADKQDVSKDMAPRQRVPSDILMRYQRQKQRRARTQVSPCSTSRTLARVCGPTSKTFRDKDDQAIFDSPPYIHMDNGDTLRSAGNTCPKPRELSLPDEMRSLQIIVHHIPEYCLRYLSRSCGSFGEQPGPVHSGLDSSLIETERLPWTTYARYYNAFQLVNYGSMRQATPQMMEAAIMVKQAMQAPTIRSLACLLSICFIVVTDTTQIYMKATLKYLANAASQMPTLGNAHPLTCILQAVASLVLSTAEAKVRIMQCLINVVQQLSMEDFDAVYESWELLILILKYSGNLVEAESQCHELIRFSEARRGFLCDSTFRARRLLGRVLMQRGQITQAEELFLRMEQEWNINSALFEKSPSDKEWQVWENLAHISALRGDMKIAEQYLRLAHDFSSQKYGDTNGNTVRVLADLVKLLKRDGKAAEIPVLEGQYSGRSDL